VPAKVRPRASRAVWRYPRAHRRGQGQGIHLPWLSPDDHCLQGLRREAPPLYEQVHHCHLFGLQRRSGVGRAGGSVNCRKCNREKFVKVHGWYTCNACKDIRDEERMNCFTFYFCAVLVFGTCCMVMKLIMSII